VAALNAFIVPMSNRRQMVDAQRLASIAGACRDRESLRFQYQKRSGDSGVRMVEPHRLVYTGYRWYLAAWDLGREDWRTFRVDRIEGKLKTSTRFKSRNPPDGDFEAFVSKSLSQTPYPIRARVTLNASMETISNRIPPSAGVLEAIDDGSCMLRTGSHSLEALAIHLSLIGVDFRVHEPPDLITYIRGLADRLKRAAS
jgi:predicted DNA-binding transcriptional regulator YafY